MAEFADWTRAYVMMGDSPVGIREVLLAADGSLYALLQGETVEGALQTVRLDAEGRLSAFVIDSVDAWGEMLSIGNAELAARLGSPVLYEQSGRVQFIETFEFGLQRWDILEGGTGAEVAIDPTHCLSGGYSCKMTGGSDTTLTARIRFSQGLLPKGKIGLAFAISSGVEFDKFEFTLHIYDGVDLHYVKGRLDDTSNDLLIFDDTPGWQDVGDADPSSGDPSKFYFVKIVADLDADTYDTFKFNQQEIDISAYSLLTGATADPPSIDILLQVISHSGDNDTVYIDDVILTLAEP